MRRSTVRVHRWPALLLALIPGLLAAKGCYFGEQDVPLGGNFKAAAGGQPSIDDVSGSAGSDASHVSGSAGANAHPSEKPRDPSVFFVP